MKGSILAAIIVGVIVVFALSFVFSYISWSNEALKFEADIPAQYQQMQNVYDNGWKQVMEENQISDKYASQIKDIFQGVMTGRYGDNGSKAIFQLIHEDNPKVDPSLLKKVQESIERFHAEFQGSQTKIIALKQSYQTYVFATTSGRIYNVVGNYPHIKCGVPAGSADEYQIVTSSKTQIDFKNHQSEPLNLK